MTFYEDDFRVLSFPWMSSLRKLTLMCLSIYEQAAFELPTRLAALPVLETLVLDSFPLLRFKVVAGFARLPALRHLSLVKCCSIKTSKIMRFFASTPVTVLIEEFEYDSDDVEEEEGNSDESDEP